MFQFKEEDTRIFQYSRGEKNEDGTFKTIYADPAAIKRLLGIHLPNINQLIDQYRQAEALRRQKAAEDYASWKAHQDDPNVPLKIIEFSGDDNATIRMGAIAHQNLCLGIRAVFDLLPFDPNTGSGCTDYMAITVNNAYTDWLEKKDGSTPESPTSSPPASAA